MNSKINEKNNQIIKIDIKKGKLLRFDKSTRMRALPGCSEKYNNKKTLIWFSTTPSISKFQPLPTIPSCTPNLPYLCPRPPPPLPRTFLTYAPQPPAPSDHSNSHRLTWRRLKHQSRLFCADKIGSDMNYSASSPTM